MTFLDFFGFLDFCGAHPTCATEMHNSVAHGHGAPQNVTFLWRMGLVRHRNMTFCGAWGRVRHRKSYFCGARGWCATEIRLSVAHGVLVRHIITKFCGAFKIVRHRNNLCGAWLIGAPQKVVPPIACFLVVYVERLVSHRRRRVLDGGTLTD